MTKTARGFTLVELLVALAIIGLLASIVLASLNSARAKAEDARKSVIMQQYKLALDFIYQKTGGYPAPSTTGIYCIDVNPCGWNNGWPGDTTIATAFREFISLPRLNPINGALGTFIGPAYNCTAITNGVCTSGDIRWFTDPSLGTCPGGTEALLTQNLLRCRYIFP
jgi:prepilin-type N-terminal cleavage/methylation domain-containing protein